MMITNALYTYPLLQTLQLYQLTNPKGTKKCKNECPAKKSRLKWRLTNSVTNVDKLRQ